MHSIKEHISAFSRLRSKVGLYGALKYAIRYVYRIFFKIRGSDISKRDLAAFYAFIIQEEFCSRTPLRSGAGSLYINWIIPDFSIGSGGHLNIFRLIYNLEKRGIECNVVIIPPTHFSSDEDARKCIQENFFPIHAHVYTNIEDIPAADVTFATSWQTAYYLRAFRDSGKKMYFVQDFEPYFYARGSEYYLARDTYNFGFTGITAGKWLANKLKNDFGMQTYCYGFSYDKDLYYPRERMKHTRRHIFFYARPVTERRGFTLGVLALNELCKRYSDLCIVLAGWDVSDYHFDFPHVNYGTLPIDELPDLYSQCEFALVLSFTNVSLLPLELMGSGCPVVSNRGENVEWLLNDKNSMLVDIEVRSITEGMAILLDNEEKRRRLSEDGLLFAKSTSWDEEADVVAGILGDHTK